jgi:hypothetical protein
MAKQYAAVKKELEDFQIEIGNIWYVRQSNYLLCWDEDPYDFRIGGIGVSFCVSPG